MYSTPTKSQSTKSHTPSQETAPHTKHQDSNENVSMSQQSHNNTNTAAGIDNVLSIVNISPFKPSNPLVSTTNSPQRILPHILQLQHTTTVDKLSQYSHEHNHNTNMNNNQSNQHANTFVFQPISLYDKQQHDQQEQQEFCYSSGNNADFGPKISKSKSLFAERPTTTDLDINNSSFAQHENTDQQSSLYINKNGVSTSGYRNPLFKNATFYEYNPSNYFKNDATHVLDKDTAHDNIYTGIKRKSKDHENAHEAVHLDDICYIDTEGDQVGLSTSENYQTAPLDTSFSGLRGNFSEDMQLVTRGVSSPSTPAKTPVDRLYSQVKRHLLTGSSDESEYFRLFDSFNMVEHLENNNQVKVVNYYISNERTRFYFGKCFKSKRIITTIDGVELSKNDELEIFKREYSGIVDKLNGDPALLNTEIMKMRKKKKKKRGKRMSREGSLLGIQTEKDFIDISSDSTDNQDSCLDMDSDSDMGSDSGSAVSPDSDVGSDSSTSSGSDIGGEMSISVVIKNMKGYMNNRGRKTNKNDSDKNDGDRVDDNDGLANESENIGDSAAASGSGDDSHTVSNAESTDDIDDVDGNRIFPQNNTGENGAKSVSNLISASISLDHNHHLSHLGNLQNSNENISTPTSKVSKLIEIINSSRKSDISSSKVGMQRDGKQAKTYSICGDIDSDNSEEDNFGGDGDGDIKTSRAEDNQESQHESLFFNKYKCQEYPKLKIEKPSTPKEEEKNDKVTDKPFVVESDNTYKEKPQCPICYEHYSTEAEFRPVSLKCGHVYCKKCTYKWFCTTIRNQKSSGHGNSIHAGINSKQRIKPTRTSRAKCPRCNRQSQFGDLREIYPNCLIAIDTEKLDTANRNYQAATSENTVLRVRISNLEAELNRYKIELATLRNRLGRVYDSADHQGGSDGECGGSHQAQTYINDNSNCGDYGSGSGSGNGKKELTINKNAYTSDGFCSIDDFSLHSDDLMLENNDNSNINENSGSSRNDDVRDEYPNNTKHMTFTLGSTVTMSPNAPTKDYLRVLLINENYGNVGKIFAGVYNDKVGKNFIAAFDTTELRDQPNLQVIPSFYHEGSYCPFYRFISTALCIKEFCQVNEPIRTMYVDHTQASSLHTDVYFTISNLLFKSSFESETQYPQNPSAPQILFKAPIVIWCMKCVEFSSLKPFSSLITNFPRANTSNYLLFLGLIGGKIVIYSTAQRSAIKTLSTKSLNIGSTPLTHINIVDGQYLLCSNLSVVFIVLLSKINYSDAETLEDLEFGKNCVKIFELNNQNITRHITWISVFQHQTNRENDTTDTKTTLYNSALGHHFLFSVKEQLTKPNIGVNKANSADVSFVSLFYLFRFVSPVDNTVLPPGHIDPHPPGGTNSDLSNSTNGFYISELLECIPGTTSQPLQNGDSASSSHPLSFEPVITTNSVFGRNEISSLLVLGNDYTYPQPGVTTIYIAVPDFLASKALIYKMTTMDTEKRFVLVQTISFNGQSILDLKLFHNKSSTIDDRWETKYSDLVGLFVATEYNFHVYYLN